MNNELKLYNPDDGCLNSIMTFAAETPEEKVKLYNMTSNPDKALSDCIGDTIAIKDVYIEVAQVKNDNTGELDNVPRTIIIDTKGVSYACVSSGIYHALVRMFNIFGMPTWEDGIPVKVKQINKDKNRILTLAVVSGD